ncbi:gp45 [Niallia circulans]|uniref:replication protein n=1 Tax=Niallia circulans TaxID=1397 RepID=UPI0009EE2B8D|nr:replication protein [Niallia circulans]MDR4318418.1 replication protein [Niallia circulans]MED3839259.1 replication protein [Niallia circulans]MED4242396.1 replication protein [Niallia circulans]MED4250498.1 replication protein [Niallia circulans]QKH59814.1 replication protein [Niallia circulans]
MANPQIEQGHTRIANEILEHISKTNLNGTQFRIVMVVWRYTYGFQRKQHELSSSFLSTAIGIKDRKSVNRELKILIERNIIFAIGKGSRGANIISFNKNFDEWKEPLLATHPTVVSVGDVPHSSVGDVPHSSVGDVPHRTVGDVAPQERKKKNIKKNTRQQKKYDEESSYFKMATYFYDKVLTVAKDAGVEHLVKKANMQKWADEFRKLIEIDEVDKRLAKDVMDWVTKDSFWRTNVLSAKKLREKFGELAIKMKSSKTTKQPTQQQPQQDFRDKDIAFSKFVAAGGDPSEFDWSS